MQLKSVPMAACENVIMYALIVFSALANADRYAKVVNSFGKSPNPLPDVNQASLVNDAEITNINGNTKHALISIKNRCNTMVNTLILFFLLFLCVFIFKGNDLISVTAKQVDKHRR